MTSNSILAGPRRLFCAVCNLSLATIVLICFLEFAAFVGWSVHDLFRPEGQLGMASSSPAYARYLWAAEFWREENSRWKSQRRTYVPFVVWGNAPWHGKYVNTDHTPMGELRRTINASNARCAGASKASVWVFGGSTVQGSGVPDWATIPSYLSKELNEGGQPCVEVANFGVEGYVTNQEVILLQQQLKGGHHPDYVIFYDGVNDSYAGMISPATPGSHLNFERIKARVEGSFLARVDFISESYTLKTARAIHALLANSKPHHHTDAEPDAQAGRTLDEYEANLVLLQDLAQTYRFKLYAFWQPALIYGHKPITPFEKQIIHEYPDLLDANANSDSFREWAAAYKEAARRSERNGQFVFLGDLFDETAEPLYIDEWMHLDPQGNELVAHAIVSSMHERPVPHQLYGKTARQRPDLQFLGGVNANERRGRSQPH